MKDFIPKIVNKQTGAYEEFKREDESDIQLSSKKSENGLN